MTTLYSGIGDVLISIDQVVSSYVTTMSFDYVGNEALLDDIMVNSDHYLLLPGPDLQKDGVSVVPANMTPAAGSWRAQRAAMAADGALITAATTVSDLKPILEDMRATLLEVMDLLGEQW